MAATRAPLLPAKPATATRALARSRPGAGRKSGFADIDKMALLKSHSIDKLPSAGKPPGIRDEPVRPCRTPSPSIPAPSPRTAALPSWTALAQARPFSCQRGECGSCRATVLEGRYEHRAGQRTFLCHRRRRAADVPVPRGRRSAPDISALAGAGPARAVRARVMSRLPLAPGVTQLIVEMEDARPTPGCRDGMCALAGRWRPTQLLHRQCAGRRYAGLSGFGRHGFGRHNGEPLRRAPRCRAVPRRTSSSAMRPVRLEFHIRRMPGGVFTDGILPRLAPGDTLTLEGPLAGLAGATVRRCRMTCRMAHRMFTTARTIWCCWPPARDSRACSPS